MEEILIINTGGTFNKRYNPIKGELEVSKDSISVEKILKNFFNLEYKILNIIHKDSLDMLEGDREEIVRVIHKHSSHKVLIIHGTDTMGKTASYLHSRIKDKFIVLTGAMVPFSIDPLEANSNFSMAIGYLLNERKEGVFISMHGLVSFYKNIFKDRDLGVFRTNL